MPRLTGPVPPIRLPTPAAVRTDSSHCTWIPAAGPRTASSHGVPEGTSWGFTHTHFFIFSASRISPHLAFPVHTRCVTAKTLEETKVRSACGWRIVTGQFTGNQTVKVNWVSYSDRIRLQCHGQIREGRCDASTPNHFFA